MRRGRQKFLYQMSNSVLGPPTRAFSARTTLSPPPSCVQGLSMTCSPGGSPASVTTRFVAERSRLLVIAGTTPSCQLSAVSQLKVPVCEAVHVAVHVAVSASAPCMQSVHAAQASTHAIFLFVPDLLFMATLFGDFIT